MKSLEGKKVLVTGAKRGLGKSLVEHYRRVGAKVIPVTREECDLRDTRQIYSFLDSVGRVDVLVNCAGVFPINELHNISLKQYNECIQVNLTAPFILSQ